MDIEQVWQPGKFRLQVQGAQSPVLLGRAGAGRVHDGHGQAVWHLHAGGKQGGGPGD
jgi:hypothetical protein